MAMETDMSFFTGSHPMDLPMDGSFPDFANQSGLLDSRHPTFDRAFSDKPSPGTPGTPSQFLLTPSSLWDRPSFDDSAMDIFADFNDGPEQASEQPSEPLPAQVPQAAKQIPKSNPDLIKIKQEPPVPVPSTRPPPVTRRSTRATSGGSHAPSSSISDKVSAASTDTSKVRKPRATTKRTTKRAKNQTKEKQLLKEELEEDPGQNDEALHCDDLPPGEDSVRRNKFLERNRVAASKCRQKKKEWMHSLEDTKIELEKTHNSLHEILNGLLAEISVMKEHLMIHASCGDQNIDRWFSSEARKFVESKTRSEEARRPSTSSGSGETQQSSRSA